MEVSVKPGQRVRETRSALIEHYKQGHFVHRAALFAPELRDLSEILKLRDVAEVDVDDQAEGAADGVEQANADPVSDEDGGSAEATGAGGEAIEELDTAYDIAAE